MLEFERAEWARGRRRVGGVDEAGRGPLAGPVVAACVVFDPAFAEREQDGALRGLTDSKRLRPAERERFHALLTSCEGVDWALGTATREEIDHLNILRATWLAMRRAVEALPEPPDALLVDGHPVPKLPAPALAIVGGDGRSLSIAAASVIAKVSRDRRMAELDRTWPGYGFARHKGYGTRAHLAALAEFGPTSEHRRSFRPVAERCPATETTSAPASDGVRTGRPNEKSPFL
mgnify:CR=1 FL=1